MLSGWSWHALGVFTDCFGHFRSGVTLCYTFWDLRRLNLLFCDNSDAQLFFRVAQVAVYWLCDA